MNAIMTPRTLIWSFCSVCVINLVACVVAEDSIKLELDNQYSKWNAFQLKARLNIYENKAERRLIRRAFRIEEHHSNEIKFSHFVVKKAMADGDSANAEDEILAEFYKIDSFEPNLHVDRSIWSCEKKRDMFDNILGGSIPDEQNEIMLSMFSTKSNELFKELAKPPDHVTGLARLLHLVSMNSHRLNSLEIQQKIKNIMCNIYRLETKQSIAYKKVVILVYLIADDAEKLITADSLFPVKIKIIFDKGYQMMIYFDSIGKISQREEVHPENQDYILDKFTIDPRFGCGQALNMHQTTINSASSPRMVSMRFEKIDFFKLKKNEELSFTFEKQFVAYDGSSSAFRRDIFRESGDYSTTIYDLKGHKKFNVLRSSEKSSACITAEIIESLYEPLFPFKQFSYLGTGRVRSIKVHIYEQLTSGNRLPAVFFTQYQDSLRMSSDYNDHKSQSSGQHSLSVIYYFAESSQLDQDNSQENPIGSLLRVDVFATHSGEHLTRIDVFDAVWQLGPAPNGDSANELFSMPDKCAELLQGGTEIRLKLEFKWNQSFGVDKRPLDEIHQLLVSDVQARNELFLTMMETQTPYSRIQISQFDSISQLESNGTKLNVFVKVKLPQLSKNIGMNLYKPTDAVQVILRNGSITRAQSSRATNFEECFFEAARERSKGEPILFAYHPEGCLIDSRPVYEIDKNTNRLVYTYSNIFDIFKSANNSANLDNSRLTSMTKEILIEKAGQFEEDIDGKLRGRRLLARIFDGGKIGQTLCFEVTQVEIVSSGLLPSNQLLASLSLTSGKRIKHKDQSAISFEDCHAACLGDFSCRSFSVCFDPYEKLSNQCLTSDLDLSNFDELWKIEVARKQKLNLILDGKLKLDKRCQTYIKNPLEMFSRMQGESLIVLSSRSMSYVTDMSACAQKCIERNLLIVSTRDQESTKSVENENILAASSGHARASRRSQFCTQFEYVEFDLIENIAQKDIPDFLKALHLNDAKQTGGVCLLSRNSNLNGTDDHSDNDPRFKSNVQLYKMDFEHLFEQQQDIQMVQDGMTEIDLVHNKRRIIGASDVRTCAEACFLQLGGLVPMCQSFDFLIVRKIQSADSKNQTQYSSTKVCALNSMTLREAKQSGQYESLVIERKSSNEPHSVWHYDLRQAYASGDNLLRENFSIQREDKMNNRKLDYSQFAIILIVCFAIVTGQCMVIVLKQRFSNWLELNFSSQQQDLQPLRVEPEEMTTISQLVSP